MSRRIKIIILCSALVFSFHHHAGIWSRAKNIFSLASHTAIPETTLGITHFIIGAPQQIAPLPVEKSEPAIEQTCAYSSAKKVLFSPDDDLPAALIDLIDREQKAIAMAVFTFTHKKVANALLEAHNRGVAIEVIVDPNGAKDRNCKLSMLQKAGIITYVYNPFWNQEFQQSSLMHHKFVLFKQNEDNKPVLWTGSYNVSVAGRHNQENALIIDDPTVIRKFNNQFTLLKDRCVACATQAAGKRGQKVA